MSLLAKRGLNTTCAHGAFNRRGSAFLEPLCQALLESDALHGVGNAVAFLCDALTADELTLVHVVQTALIGRKRLTLPGRFGIERPWPKTPSSMRA